MSEELAAPGRSVHVESFDDFRGPGSRVTTLFDEMDGTTMVTVLPTSEKIRDAVVASGIEHGATESYNTWGRPPRAFDLTRSRRGVR